MVLIFLTNRFRIVFRCKKTLSEVIKYANYLLILKNLIVITKSKQLSRIKFKLIVLFTKNPYFRVKVCFCH